MLLSEEKIIAIAKQTGMLHPIEQEMNDASMAYTRAIEAAVLAEQAKVGPVGMFRIRGGDVVHMEPYLACLDIPSGDYLLYLHPAPAPEGMVKDAERYRWLRDSRVVEIPADRDGPAYKELRFYVAQVNIESHGLDAAIDAAMKEQTNAG